MFIFKYCELFEIGSAGPFTLSDMTCTAEFHSRGVSGSHAGACHGSYPCGLLSMHLTSARRLKLFIVLCDVIRLALHRLSRQDLVAD